MCPRTRNSATMNCVPSVSWFIIPWPLVDLLFTHLALYTEINRHYSSYMFEFLSLKRKRNPLPLKKIKNKNKYLQKELYIMKQRRKTHNSHILIGWYIYIHTNAYIWGSIWSAILYTPTSSIPKWSFWSLSWWSSYFPMGSIVQHEEIFYP